MTTNEQLERFFQAAKDAGCPPDQAANFINAGYVPQPRQLQFHAAARACDDPDGPDEVGFGGARGPGKSHATLAQIALDDCRRVPGLKCLFLRNVQKAARESFEDLVQRVLRGVAFDYKPSRGRLDFPNGSRIVLGGYRNESDIDKYLGIEYDLIAIEEATQLSLSKYLNLRTSLRTSKVGWRPRVYNSTNPGGIGHAWYKKRFIEPWRRQAETFTRFVPATVRDNAFVNPEYRRTLEDLVGWQRRAWLDGDWDIAAGQFFTTFNRDVHVLTADRYPEIPDNWRVWLSLDYGFTHYTVCHLLAQDGDGTIFVVDEHAQRQWLVPRHVEAIEAMLARNGIDPTRIWKFVAGADVFAKRHDGSTIAQQYSEARSWIKLTPAIDDRVNGAAEIIKRLGDVEAGIPASLFIFDRCRMLVECLPALQHDPHRPEDVLKVDADADGTGGDDPYDSLRYGVMAVTKRTAKLRAKRNPFYR